MRSSANVYFFHDLLIFSDTGPLAAKWKWAARKMGELIPLGDLNVTLQHQEKRTDPSRWCRSLELAAKPEVGVALNFASRRHLAIPT